MASGSLGVRTSSSKHAAKVFLTPIDVSLQCQMRIERELCRSIMVAGDSQFERLLPILDREVKSPFLFLAWQHVDDAVVVELHLSRDRPTLKPLHQTFPVDAVEDQAPASLPAPGLDPERHL